MEERGGRVNNGLVQVQISREHPSNVESMT
jgi:hypothetical protein